MRWPWQSKPEKRESGGDFSDAVVRLIESQAAGTAADAASTAAVEAAAGSLSRAFTSAKVSGPDWLRETVTPEFLAQVGRDLVRSGRSMHYIKMNGAGLVSLIPASSWHFEGGEDPKDWTVRVTTYGPSTSITRNIPRDGVVFVRWGGAPGQRYVGVGPLRWASTTARLQSETERSLADEAGGPVGNILTVPAGTDGGDDEDGDPMAALKGDIRSARGKALLLETTASGYDTGRTGAPARDWKPERLGPKPPDSLAMIRKDTFNAVLAACGISPALYSDQGAGPAQKAAYQRFILLTVEPLATLLEHELTERLEVAVKLDFTALRGNEDVLARAQSLRRFVESGIELEKALALSGLLAVGDE